MGLRRLLDSARRVAPVPLVAAALAIGLLPGGGLVPQFPETLVAMAREVDDEQPPAIKVDLPIVWSGGAVGAAVPAPSAPPDFPGGTGAPDRVADRSACRIRAADGESRLIVLDPGHGGSEGGAARKGRTGTIREKDLTLATVLKVASYLWADDWKVVLTRDTDTTVNRGRDVNGDGAVTLMDDLQARIDIANGNKAAVFVSIHYNAAENEQRGTETFYNPERPFADRSKRLATHIQDELLRSLDSLGFQPRNRGVIPDTRLLDGGTFYLLGDRKHIVRPSQMPAALGEALFLTNDAEFALVERPETIDAIALAYTRAIERYLSEER